MLQSTQGIVLHTTPFSESSIVAKIYTQHWGIQAFLINSVRSSKARNKASLFQVLNVIELEAYHKQNRGLQKISKVHNVLSLQQNVFDPAKTGIAFFIAEIVYKSIKEAEPDAELFDFLIDAIHQLIDTTDSIGNFHLSFLIEFSRYLGFYPHYNQHEVASYFDLKEANFTPLRPMHQYYVEVNESAVIENLMRTGISESHTIALSKENRKALLHSLLTYYNLHISNWGTIKSLTVLEDLFS